MVSVTATVNAEITGPAEAIRDLLEMQPYPIPESDRFAGTRGFLPANDLATIAVRGERAS